MKQVSSEALPSGDVEDGYRRLDTNLRMASSKIYMLPSMKGRRAIVASFADVDNLTQSSTVGRLLGDIVGSRPFTAGIYRCRYTVLGKTLFLFKEQGGEFVLSRDVRALSESQ